MKQQAPPTHIWRRLTLFCGRPSLLIQEDNRRQIGDIAFDKGIIRRFEGLGIRVVITLAQRQKENCTQHKADGPALVGSASICRLRFAGREPRAKDAADVTKDVKNAD